MSTILRSGGEEQELVTPVRILNGVGTLLCAVGLGQELVTPTTLRFLVSLFLR